MTAETIKKLMTSNNPDDRLLAINLLVGKSRAEVRELFGLTHTNSHTLIKNINFYIHRDRMTYRVSADCIIYLGYNMSIAAGPHSNHVDLTV